MVNNTIRNYFNKSKGGDLMSSIFYENCSLKVLNLSEQPLIKLSL